jgi:fatty-acid desaturase
MVKTSKYLKICNSPLEAMHGVILPFFGKVHAHDVGRVSSNGSMRHQALFVDFATCYSVLGWQIYSNTWLSWRGLLCLLVFTYIKLCATFTVLHRFFSHKAFTASRPVTFLLGVVATTVSNR